MGVSGNLNGLLYEILPLKLRVFILGVSKKTPRNKVLHIDWPAQIIREVESMTQIN